MVSVLMGVIGEVWYMLSGKVGLSVVGWVGAGGGTCHSWQ